MEISQRDREFLSTHNSAAMITIGEDAVPKVARVGIAVVDDKIWSSGTVDRVRTRRLRRDPRAVLYVHDPGFAWLALETRVDILDGSDAARQNLRLFRVMQNRSEGPLSWFGQELADAAFLDKMVEEKRLIYEFNVDRSYGLH